MNAIGNVACTVAPLTLAWTIAGPAVAEETMAVACPWALVVTAGVTARRST